ncbi:hypothetical protein [Phormidium tenue]|nr:hypothetical protein [Phormidium tenue]
MEFEFDESKSRLNKLKHGVNFVEAQTLWQDNDRCEKNNHSQKRTLPTYR